MRGDLDMGDHNIVGVDDEIVIGGQGLNTDDVDLLNQMSALNCPNAVQISGGVAQCTAVLECRICYEVDRSHGGTQCDPDVGPQCSGWTSGAVSWTPWEWDDTDDSHGGCGTRYRVECR